MAPQGNREEEGDGGLGEEVGRGHGGDGRGAGKEEGEEDRVVKAVSAIERPLRVQIHIFLLKK